MFFYKEKRWELQWNGFALYLCLSFGDETVPRYTTKISRMKHPWFLKWKVIQAEQLILATVKADTELFIKEEQRKRMAIEGRKSLWDIPDLPTEPPVLGQRPQLKLIKGGKR